MAGPGARKKFGAPTFEREEFREQTYCTEESTCNIVSTSRRPGYCAPRRCAPVHVQSFQKVYLKNGTATICHQKVCFSWKNDH